MEPISETNDSQNIIIKNEFKDTFNNLIQYHSAFEKHQLDSIFDIWYSTFLSKVRVYSTLSAHFFYLKPYGMNEAGENVEIFLRNIALLKDIAKERKIEELDNFNSFIEKIKDHIELIGIQVNRMDSGVEQIETYKESLSANIEELQINIKKSQKEFNDLSTEISNLTEQQKDAVKKAKKVQKEFVTILGIFATILITTFGGLTSLSSIFNNINNAGTGKLVLLGSFVMFTVILIVFLLLNGISKLSELNIRSCGCEVNTSCNCPIAKKHPTLYIVAVILVVTAILGISEYIIDYKSLVNDLDDWKIFFILSIVITVITIVTTITFRDARNRAA